MPIQISISNAVGARSATASGGIDPDAQAFITAAAITDPTQQAAINTLVVDLKGYSIWSKMKALYPFVGGTAVTHKWNLKNPLDTDAAFRILWSGGVTHSSNGVQFGGVNGYGDTRLNALANTAISNVSFGLYSRTNNIRAASNGVVDSFGGSTCGISLATKWSDNNTYYSSNNYVLDGNGNFVTDTRGLFVATKDTSLAFPSALYRNGIGIRSATPTFENRPNGNVYLGARNNLSAIPNAEIFDNKELAFAFIGNTLTATDNSNFYTAVQAFQTTIGRSIGTQTVSDADAQAFVTAADIQDQVEANAINNLVIGMKADGTWTKMKAIYPFVGGTSSTHKFNLKDPRDLDAAFRLVFSGGITHSANGALFNGINGFADTKLASSGNLTQNSTHFSAYSRTNNTSGGYIMANGNAGASGECKIFTRWFDNNCYSGVNTFSQNPTANADSRGCFIANRIASNVHSIVIRGTKIDFSTTSSGLNTNTFRICSAIGVAFDNKEIAFSSIGDGLTNTDMTNLTTRIDNFQLALNRNV